MWNWAVLVGKVLLWRRPQSEGSGAGSRPWLGWQLVCYGHWWSSWRWAYVTGPAFISAPIPSIT